MERAQRRHGANTGEAEPLTSVCWSGTAVTLQVFLGGWAILRSQRADASPVGTTTGVRLCFSPLPTQPLYVYSFAACSNHHSSLYSSCAAQHTTSAANAAVSAAAACSFLSIGVTGAVHCCNTRGLDWAGPLLQHTGTEDYASDQRERERERVYKLGCCCCWLWLLLLRPRHLKQGVPVL